MGRVKKENPAEEEVLQGMEIDTTPQEDIVKEIPLHKEEHKEYSEAPKSNGNEPVNCLRKERIIVRFVPSQTAMVQRKGHILSGGMAETATRSFVVPRLAKTGMFKNVLTDSEKTCLERLMGLEINALSIYKKENNFWDDSNPNGIGRVTLHKQDNYLDLSIPEQYIQYKILLANKDYIAASMEEFEERPRQPISLFLFLRVMRQGRTSARWTLQWSVILSMEQSRKTRTLSELSLNSSRRGLSATMSSWTTCRARLMTTYRLTQESSSLLSRMNTCLQRFLSREL